MSGEEVIKHLNWPTALLVLATGGLNFWSTKESGDQSRHEIDATRATIRTIYQKQLEEVKQQSSANADHIEMLSGRIEQLEHIINESRDAANKAADTSIATNETVKKIPPPRQTTVIHRNKIQRIQKVQKVYKLF